MPTLLTVAVVAVIGIAAYVRARRAGIWSWRRFGVSTGVLLVIGGGIGLAVSLAGRWIGSEHALLLTVIAAVLIVAAVFAFALMMRRRLPPR